MKLIMAWLFHIEVHIPLLVRDTDSQPRACTIRPFYYSYSPNKNDSKTRIFPREEFDEYVSFFFYSSDQNARFRAETSWRTRDLLVGRISLMEIVKKTPIFVLRKRL